MIDTYTLAILALLPIVALSCWRFERSLSAWLAERKEANHDD